MNRAYYLAVFTTAQPHHSRKSGYEQLAGYVEADVTHWRTRTNTPPLIKRATAKLLRPRALSNWYQWDGIEAEKKALQLSRQHPDNLVAHFLYGDTSLGLLPRFRKHFNGRIVATFHACPSDFERVIRNPELLPCVDHFILLGSNQKAKLSERGVPSDNMTVIPHGVDTGFYAPSSGHHKVEGGAFHVLMVGNWRRNFDLYKAVLRRYANDDGVRFTMITARHNQQPFEDFDNISLYDGLTDEELLAYYQQADCMLLGVEDAVANNVLLEALACGTPVISERVGAIPEYLDERCGIMFAPDRDDEAVQAIETLRASPGKLKSMAGEAVDWVQQFSWPVIGREVQQVYDRVYHGTNT